MSGARQFSNSPNDMVDDAIAIVGIGCRYPGGIGDPSQFWQFLCERECAIRPIPAERWNRLAFKSFGEATQYGAFLDDVYTFDAGFFGISPREAEGLDPQQSNLLEVTCEALEDARLPLRKASQTTTGVFVGIMTSDYRSLVELGRATAYADTYAATGIALSIAANRISHRLDLKGPSIAVDTACSSSMVAVDLACKSLRAGDCEIAIAAGVNVLLDPSPFILFSNAQMLSPTGRVSTFDAKANGYVRGEGCGAVVLKSFRKALDDGDEIYGLIRSTAMNQDGRTRTLTAPSRDAQIAMLQRLCRIGRIDPAHIGFVECHGTGTPTGDPIEAGAVGYVFGAAPRESPLMIGSVKPNVGHQEAAAGITGLIKAALIARYRMVPPNINFSSPNPEIPLGDLNLTVPLDPTPLPEIAGRHLVVVNSFGFGGTNASALIESWTPKRERRKPAAPAATEDKPVVVPLSAASENALREVARHLGASIGTGCMIDGVTPIELASAIAADRDHLSCRAAFVCSKTADLKAQLEAFANTTEGQRTSAIRGRAADANRICFTFAGQGSQWYAMGRELIDREPVYAEALSCFDAIFTPLAGWSVRAALTADEANSNVDDSIVTQPTICALQIALAALWRHFGVTPDMVVGHSLGEVAAAHVAGAIDLETTVRLIHHRSLIRTQITQNGAMAVIGLSIAELEPLLPDDGSIEIAGHNAPTTVTVSGDRDAIEIFVRDVKAERPDLMVRLVNTDTAWHSRHLEAGETWFRANVGQIRYASPKIPFISTVTGNLELRLDVDYWWMNLRKCVRFDRAVQSAVTLGANIFLELAPQRTLTGPTAQTLAARGAKAALLNSLDRKRGDLNSMTTALAELYVLGVDIDWRAAAPADYRRLDLPKYPWDKARYTRLPPEAKQYLFEKPRYSILGQRSSEPVATWRALINLRSCPYLAHHRLRDECLFPAAGYIDIMLAAGLELFGKGPIEIEDIRIYDALFLEPNSTVVLQTVYQADRGALRIYSLEEKAGADWELRSEGRVYQRDTERPPQQPIAIERPLKFEKDIWYRPSGVQNFIHLGPMFQTVKSVDIEVDGYRAVAELQSHAMLGHGLADHVAHPTLLDAALQLTDHNIATLGATTNSSFDLEGKFVGTTHSVPTYIRRVLLLRPLVETMTLDVRHKVTGGRLHGNTSIFRSPDGSALIVVEDVSTKGIPIGVERESAGPVEPTVLEEVYHPLGIASEGSSDGPALTGRILVLADDLGRASSLVSTLLSHGAEVETIRRGDAETADIAGLRSLVEKCLDAGPVSFVVFAFPLGQSGLDSSATTEQVLEATERDILAFIGIGQALQRRREPKMPTGLVLLTRMARQLPGDPGIAVEGIVQSPLVGLARTLAVECEGCGVIQIDLDDHALANPLLVLQAMTHQGRETEMVLRSGKMLVPRIERRMLDNVPPVTRQVAATERNTNYVVAMNAPGLIDAIEVREADMPRVGDDDVLLEMKAVGLNFRDIMAATGLLPAEAEPEPAWRNLGLEYSAVVSAVGENVKTLKAGDPVMGLGRRCLQRFIAAPAIVLAKVPDGTSVEAASTIQSAFVTAHYALNRVGRLAPGERVLIHAATGGVGLAAIQLAKRAGAEIFATAGSEDKRSYLRSLGIQHVMSSRHLDFADEIMHTTDGKGVDVILNSLPNAFITKGFDILAPYGRFIEIGKRDVYADSTIGLRALRRNIQLAVVDIAALGIERPALLAELLGDITKMLNAREIEPLPVTCFPVSRSADAFRFMAQAKHIGKVVVAFTEPAVDVRVSMEKPFQLDGNGCYLVTGGSRGFGLTVADWLSRKGARHIVLCSRSGKVDETGQDLLEDLAARNTAVTNLALDVTDPRAVSCAIRDVIALGAPLRGIVHGAASIEDALLSQLDDHLVRRVVGPKIAGAWNLHRALAEHGSEVDFFVSFSSTSQLFGSRGQAAYVAANAFLDAFAHYRRSRRKAGFTVDWGPLGGSGVVSRNDQLASYLASMGMELLPEHAATKSLETLLRADRATLAYAAIDWMTFSGMHPGIKLNPRLSPLLVEVGNKNTQLRAGLAASPPEKWHAQICAFLSHEVAKVLRLPGDVPIDRALSDIGLDSLSSFEFKLRIEQQLAIEMAVSKFLRASTIERLATLVIEVICAESPSSSKEQALTAAATSAA